MHGSLLNCYVFKSYLVLLQLADFNTISEKSLSHRGSRNRDKLLQEFWTTTVVSWCVIISSTSFNLCLLLFGWNTYHLISLHSNLLLCKRGRLICNESDQCCLHYYLYSPFSTKFWGSTSQLLALSHDALVVEGRMLMICKLCVVLWKLLHSLGFCGLCNE